MWSCFKCERCEFHFTLPRDAVTKSKFFNPTTTPTKKNFSISRFFMISTGMFFSYQCSSKKFSQIVVYAREEWKDEPETKESRKEFYAPPQNVVRQICFGPTIGAVCLSPHFVVLAVVVDVIVMPLCVVFFILLATICNFYLFFVAWVIKTLKSVTIMCNMSQWRCVNIPRQATSMTLSRVPRHCFDDVYLIWWHRRNVCCACALRRKQRVVEKKKILKFIYISRQQT